MSQSNTNATDGAPECVHHLILMNSPSQGSARQSEKVRILGTYMTQKQAKDAAHLSLFDSGYEREWFEAFETRPEVLEELASSQGTGLVVFALAVDGTKFRVRISTTPNNLQLTSDNEDGRVSFPLYYVTETIIPYCSHERIPGYDTHIEGMFKTYAEARKFASTLLLSDEEGITASSYAEYCEAGPNENDCGYGENVIVHAISDNENYLVSVLKCQELESVRLAEASFKI